MQLTTLKKLLTLAAGFALIVAGIAGLIFSLAGLVVVARLEPRIEATVTERLEQLDQVLVKTADGLATADSLLSEAITIADSLEETTVYASQTLGDGVYVVDSMADLVGEQIPTTIGATQETLTSLATGTRLVDDLLTALTSVPLLGLERYNPEKPLSEGFTEVAESLGDIPRSLYSTAQVLSATQDKLQGVEGNFTAMVDNLGQITTRLEGAQSTLGEYREIVIDLQEVSSSARQSWPGWLRTLRWGVSLLLIWLGIAQLGLLTQGWELIGRSRQPVDSAG